MSYDTEDRGSTAIEEPGRRTGLIIGVIVAVVIILLIGSFLVSGLFGAGAPGSGGNNGGGAQPSLNNPAAS